jgi:hypothetical protein
VSKTYAEGSAGSLKILLAEVQGEFTLKITNLWNYHYHTTLYMNAQQLQDLGEALLEAAKDARKWEGEETR